MAINFPGSKFFANANAKTRAAVLLAAIAGVSLLMYAGVRYLSGSQPATGPSRVASAPTGLQSVPGSQLSSEYYRALMQANTQAAQQAQITGGSAIPTLVNVPGQTSQSCTVLCPGDGSANVANELDDLVRSGKLSQADANKLLDLAKRNVSVDEYAAALADLVRQGKLTPEQARKLLEAYRKQHDAALVTAGAAVMDGLIKSGKLPLDAANQLLALQKQKVSPAAYSAELARLVKEGKISPETAAQLLAAYTQEQAKEAANQNAFKLRQMAQNGEITANVAKELADLQAKNVPVDQYAAELKRLVAEGKLTPAAAAKLLADYKAQKAGGQSALLAQLAAKGGASAALVDRLANLRGNNATLGDYANELKRAVQDGLLTPEQAAELMREYQAEAAPPPPGAAPGIDTTVPGAEDFAKLQQRVQQGAATPAGPSSDQFAAARAQAEAASAEARQQRIQQLMSAMSTQAQSLVTSWQQTPAMRHQAGAPADKSKLLAAEGAARGGKGSSAFGSESSKRPLIKAGTILFAVLDTAVDSDYPDTPVMATVVQGNLKGAKLLGKMSGNQGPGQDRVALSFTLMDEDSWPKTKSVTAFAIDPETARTVLASNVNYHYMMRYGSLFASSFLSGYANAITTAGSTSTTGIFGTSTTHPQFSAGSKIAVGLGQVGTAMTNAVQGYVNTPPTVKVNAGVGLGILFMADVPE